MRFAFSTLDFASFLDCFSSDFPHLQRPKPCFYHTKSICFGKSPFSQNAPFGIHFCCLLVSLSAHFRIFLRYFSGIDFGIVFGMHFFDFWFKMAPKRVPGFKRFLTKWRPEISKKRSKNANSGFRALVINLGSIFGTFSINFGEIFILSPHIPHYRATR